MLQDGPERVQIIISPDLWELHRQLLRDAAALLVYGLVTRQGRAVTLKVERLRELTGGATTGVQHASASVQPLG